MIFQMNFMTYFLDPKRQYSCAYLKMKTIHSRDAQNNKIQHIIKKLNIKA